VIHLTFIFSSIMALLNLNISWSKHKWAIFYCLVSTIGAFCYGYDTIYYTGIQGMKPFIRDYGDRKPDGSYALSTSFLSVTASLIYVGEFVGALLTAPINDKWGRKAVFFSASIAIIVGAIIQIFSKGSYSIFCVGRIFIGLGIGQFTASCLVYIGDVAPAAIRGPALMMFQFMQSWSQFIVACINQGTETIDGTASYKIPMGLLMFLPVLMLAFLPFIPESPVWFISKDRHEEAKKSLQKINRSPDGYDATHDFNIILEQVNLEREMESQSSWASLFSDPVERRKLIYACGAMFAQQINGIQFWYTYGVVFAQSLGVAEPFTINTIINIVQIIAVGASVLLSSRISRRTNLLVCTVGMIISLVAVGGLGTTHRGGPFSRGVGIAIVVFAFLNVVFFNFSIGTLSYTIASEMAVGRNRNKITASAIGVFFFTVWFMVFTAPYLYYDANLGPIIGFIYGGMALLTLAYVWFCVGETTGRTNTEIEKFFAEKIPVREWSTHVFPQDDYQIEGPEKKQIVIEQVESTV
jgi:sugar porter (SP) family MFS transporter